MRGARLQATPDTEAHCLLTLTSEELKEAFGTDSSASGEAVSTGGDWLAIDEYTPDKIVARTEIADEHTRKGGTVAGATIFRFFDAMAYLVTLAQSPKGTEGFTTDVSIHFLRVAARRDVSDRRPSAQVRSSRVRRRSDDLFY